MSRDLIVFGEDWGGLPSSTQHLIRHLAADRRVLWVNSIGLRRPRLTARDLGRAWTKLSAMARRREPEVGPAGAEPPPFPVLAPRALPLPGHPIARAFNRRVLAPQVRAAARAHGLADPVLWITLPTAVDVLGHLGEGASVYYCCDDFGALAGVDHGPVLALERELADRADLVLATSPLLAERFDPAKTHLLPHGVDFGLFSRPAPRAEDLPRGGPVAGFYGSLADWIDVGLLAGVARRLPHWHLWLIGEVKTDVSALMGLPNVMLAGPRAHGALPGYAQHWQASLLPFRDTPQIRASNPLKLREYLAAGSAVVSTEFPALSGYRDLVSVADGAEAFAAALEATRSEDAAAREARRQRVRGESWAQRARAAARLIDGLP